jgi:AcrR family transcriptional regulator
VGTKERRERERVETREKILAAAREMFVESGYESVTMRAIAKRIEYTPTALYHHFPSKQALVTDLCLTDFGNLARRFHAAVAVPDPIERLRAVGRAYLEFAMRYPSHYRFMFMTTFPESPLDDETRAQQKSDPDHNAYLVLRQACEDAVKQGRFSPGHEDPDLVAQIMWASIHGLVSLRMNKGNDEFIPWRDLERTAHVATEALLRGMLKTS